jgi:hypothetical protein
MTTRTNLITVATASPSALSFRPVARITLAALCLVQLAAHGQVLFDDSHSENVANANWIVDTQMPAPSPTITNITSTTSETYWTGALSSWGVALAKLRNTGKVQLDGDGIETLPPTGAITYGDGSNSQDLSHYQAFVVCEPNTRFTATEKTAILNFVANGGGLFMVADHTGSDRNSDGWDSLMIWNDLMTNNAVQNNPFGFSFNSADVSPNSPTADSSTSDPMTHGIAGTVSTLTYSSGTTMTINNTTTTHAAVWSASSTTGVMALYGTYGAGRFAAIGDSSVVEDATSSSGTTYAGWTTPLDNGYCALNGTVWILGGGGSSPTAPTATTGAASNITTTMATLNGTVNPNGLPATAQFQYGLTTAYSSTNWVSGTLTGTTAQALSASLTGLSAGVTYHFRLSATNSLGTGNGSDQTFNTSPVVPNLAITKTHNGNFTQGDVADSYTIVVTNVGAGASSGTVTVTDAPPAGLTITAMSGSGWSTTTNGSTFSCSRSEALAGGAAYPPITVTVNVSANAPGSVTNVATVAGGGDSDPSNNTASDPTTIASAIAGGYAGVLAGWDVSGETNFGTSPLTATNKAPNLTVGGLTRGSGISTSGGTAAARAWGGNTFTDTSESAATNSSRYATFTAAANADYRVSFTNISRLDYRRSSGGPANGALQYQVGSGPFVDIAPLSYSSSSSSGASLGPISLSGIAALQNIGAGTNVTFRIVSWNGSSGGTWYIFDVATSTADDLEVQGTVVPVCSSPTAGAPTATPASTVCAGTAVTLSANATGGATPYTYQWKTNGIAIPGATASTYSIAAPTLADALNYTVDITSSCGGTASTSPALPLVVNAIPATPTAANNGPVCAGSALALSSPTVAGATYSWTGPNGFASAAQNPTVSTNATADMSGTYVVTVTVNGCSSPGGSTIAAVDPAPLGGSATPTTVTVEYGGGTNITLTGQSGSIVKWQASTNGTHWWDIVSTANPLATGDLTQTTQYRAVVQSGVCPAAASSVATVNVTQFVPPVVTAIQRLSATSIQLTFTGPAGQAYRMLESADATQPLPKWNVLTNGTFGANAEVFLDNEATGAARFYRVTSP